MAKKQAAKNKKKTRHRAAQETTLIKLRKLKREIADGVTRDVNLSVAIGEVRDLIATLSLDLSAATLGTDGRVKRLKMLEEQVDDLAGRVKSLRALVVPLDPDPALENLAQADGDVGRK
jgi:hypothetical protein